MYSMKSSFMRRTVSISTSSLDSSVFPSVMTVLAQERHRSQKLSALRAPICPALRGLCHPGKEAELRVLAHVLVELPHGERHQIRHESHDVRPFVLVNSDFIAVDLHRSQACELLPVVDLFRIQVAETLC